MPGAQYRRKWSGSWSPTAGVWLGEGHNNWCQEPSTGGSGQVVGAQLQGFGWGRGTITGARSPVQEEEERPEWQDSSSLTGSAMLGMMGTPSFSLTLPAYLCAKCQVPRGALNGLQVAPKQKEAALK